MSRQNYAWFLSFFLAKEKRVERKLKVKKIRESDALRIFLFFSNIIFID
jgi:hypothetical protein